MNEAKEYLKRVGLIQSPFISQERVIKHLEAFANEQIQKQLLIQRVVVPKGTFYCMHRDIPSKDPTCDMVQCEYCKENPEQ